MLKCQIPCQRKLHKVSYQAAGLGLSDPCLCLQVKSNLLWALVYNLCALPLAAGALLPSFGLMLSPSTAGGMMALSSISVVLNSILLRDEIRAAGPSAPKPLSLSKIPETFGGTKGAAGEQV